MVPTRRNHSHKVFISHSSKDTWVALQIGKYITSFDVKTFLDEGDIISGWRNIRAGSRLDVFYRRLFSFKALSVLNLIGLLALFGPIQFD